MSYNYPRANLSQNVIFIQINMSLLVARGFFTLNSVGQNAVEVRIANI